MPSWAFGARLASARRCVSRSRRRRKQLLRRRRWRSLARLLPQQHDGGLECWAVHSVHGKLGVDLKSLGGQQVPPTSDETIFYIVFGTFAKSEQEYDSDHGQKLLRMVSFKELLKNVSDEDVKKLSSYEKHGIELHRASRKRLLEEIVADEDAEDEEEVQEVG